MKKLIQPSKQKSGDALSWRRLLGMTLLFSLLMLLLTAASPAALAQAVNTGKNNTNTSPAPDTQASAPGARGATGGKGYFQRFPFAKAADAADTQSKDQETGVNKSDKGTEHTYQAYSFVMKMCDEGYGIAYQQLPMMGSGKPAAARDSELFDNLLTTYGLPMSDSQYQIISRENNQRLLELAFDPERVMWMTSATSQTTASAASKSMANTGEIALNAVFDRIVNGDGNGALINVANEGSVAGLAYRGNGDDVSVAEAVSMVQKMYKQVFIPMAILFLLPGAVISQVKSIVGKGFGLNAIESQSPFDGILRSIVAIFLIPGTQVILSWSIDTGNSLAYSCRDWVDLQLIANWTQQLCYDPKKSQNAIKPPNPSGGQQGAQGAGGAGGGGNSFASSGASIGGNMFGSLGAAIGGFLGGLLDTALGGYAGIGDGLAANQPEAQAVIEQQDWMGQALQTSLNGAMLMAAITLIILTALQVVTVCYLLLLGPLAGAFYAWPQVSSTHLFRGVFGKWVDGAIKVSLWRFCWMAILAIMTQRIIYMGGMPSDLKWEVAVFICFLGLLVGVPAAPFTFQPFSSFNSALQVAKQSPTSQQAMTSGGSGSGSQGTSPGGGGTLPGQGGQGTSTGSGGSTGNQSGDGSANNATGSQNDQQQSSMDGNQANNQAAGQDSGIPPGTSASAGSPSGGGVGSGNGVATSAPPMIGGGTSTGGTGGGNASAPGAGNNAGGTTTANINATVADSGSTMPSASPAVPLTPSAGTSPSSPQTITNPGAPPPAAAGGTTASAGTEGADDAGGDAGGAKKSANAGTQVASAAPDASSAIGQIAGAANGVQPPPSSSKSEDA
ncbi:MAG: hypothetical protein JSS86_04645 [Cyanobacteria bacterium SZAS LIN-2]|nr:hypothetical protein [Cyanobacteria bacterium SZAS LIN-2]